MRVVGQSPTLYSNAEQNCPQESFYSNQCFPSPLNGWNYWSLLFYGTRRTSSFVLVYVVYLSFWTFYAMGNVSSSHFSSSSPLKCEIGRLWSRQLTLVLCKYNQYVQNKWNSVQVKEYNPLSAKFVQKNFTLLELWWIQLCLTCSLLEVISLSSINSSTLSLNFYNRDLNVFLNQLENILLFMKLQVAYSNCLRIVQSWTRKSSTLSHIFFFLP